MSMAAPNGFEILTIAIAAIGGVPGAIAAIEFARKRPKLRLKVVNYVTGEMRSSPDHVRAMVLLSATVANNSTKSVVPEYFDLVLEVNGSRVLFERYLIPPDVQLHSTFQQISGANMAEHDLQRFAGTIAAGDGIHGHLMFVSDAISLAQLRGANSLVVHLKCHDVLGRDLVASDRLAGTIVTANTVYPKHGISVERRQR